MSDIQPVSNNTMSLVRPIAKPIELIALAAEVHELIEKSLVKGVDFDVIPGTGGNPTLLKPGAEKLNLAFGTSPVFEIIEKEVEHNREVPWTKKKKIWRNQFKGDKVFTEEMQDGYSLGLYRYVIRCRIMRNDRAIAECIGICSTLESKYIDRPRDCENTAIKMAQKRAYVGATLHAFALSNRFTQDVEDREEDVPESTTTTPIDEYATYDDGNVDMQNQLGEQLKKMNIAPVFWEDIGKLMHGKARDRIVLLDTVKAVMAANTNTKATQKEAPKNADADRANLIAILDKELDAFDARGGTSEQFKAQTNGKFYNDWIQGASSADIMVLTDRLKALPLK